MHCTPETGKSQIIARYYRCEYCNSLFDEPETICYREDMNGEGAWQRITIRMCPICGSEDIEASEDREAV